MPGTEVNSSHVIAVRNLEEFFRDAVDAAIHSQNLSVSGHTAHYVVNLLTLYSRSEHFYERTDDGVAIRPLAMMLDDALSSETEAQREAHYRRLGDVALFVAGFFARSFSRRAVDVDYYIAMGGNAYSTLSNSMRGTTRGAVPAVRALPPFYASTVSRFSASPVMRAGGSSDLAQPGGAGRPAAHA
jgi:hypothetical protein